MAVVDAKEVRFEHFGGLNLRDDDVADFEARDLLNVIGRPRGGVRTRDGCSRFASAALTSTVLPSGYRFIDVWPTAYQRTTYRYSIGGGQVNLVAKPALFAIAYDVSDPSATTLANAKALTILGDGSVIDHGTISVYGVSGLEGPGRLGVANGPDKNLFIKGAVAGAVAYFIGDGSDAIQTWTPTAGTVPAGNILKWWSSRMLITAINGSPSRIQASSIGDPNYWSTALDSNGNRAWTLDLEPGDGDLVVGWGAVDTYLVVFKRQRCYTIYDGDTGANRVLSPRVGANSRLAIAETPYGVAFQSQDNDVWIASGTNVKRISDKVAPLCIAPGALGYAADHLYLSITGVGTLDYDFITEEWRIHSVVLTQFAMQDFADGDGQRLFGINAPSVAGKNLFYCFDPSVNDDAGTAFDSYWESGHKKFGIETLKRITELRLEGTGTIDVSFSKDHGAETFQRTVTLASPWAQGAVLTPGVARSWGFRFHSSSDFSLDAYSANVKARAS